MSFNFKRKKFATANNYGLATRDDLEGLGRAWAPNTLYRAGTIVTYRGAPFYATTDFTSGAVFNIANWTSLNTGMMCAPATYDARWGGMAQSTQVANRVNYARVVGQPALISKVAINVGVQSGNVAVAVYSNTGTGTSARPDKRLATTGSVACPAVGEQLLTLDTPLVVVPGDWFALAADNATANFLRTVISAGTSSIASLCNQLSTYPPPAAASGLAAAASYPYIAGVE